jgi:seryl-tRNA synthetase
MLDVRRLRLEPEAVKAALARRQADLPAVADRVLARDVERRDALARVNDLKAQRNESSKKVGEL